MKRTLSRRLALQSLAAAVGAVALRHAYADGLPKLDIKDPAATAVAYVENATRVDANGNPTFIKGSNCGNCSLLQGKEGNDYRPCSLFPGKLVAVSGWCSGWAVEM